jgi:hypothetical protein
MGEDEAATVKTLEQYKTAPRPCGGFDTFDQVISTLFCHGKVWTQARNLKIPIFLILAKKGITDEMVANELAAACYKR